jgi:Spy/CpxP family protein refolding chaperone
MTRKKLFAIVAGVALVIGALSWGAYAHRPHGHHRMDWIAKRLNLDDQQKVKLEAIHEAMKQAREEFKGERAALLDEVTAQIQSDQLDQAKVLQFIEQRLTRMNQAAPQIIAKVAELHATLTPEQKAKVIEHLERRKERLQDHD